MTSAGSWPTRAAHRTAAVRGHPGLVAVLNPGQSAVATLTLKAGTTYTAICFVSNPKGPHFAQGMPQDPTPR